MNEMSVDKLWNEFVLGENRRIPEESLYRLRLVHHEIHME